MSETWLMTMKRLAHRDPLAQVMDARHLSLECTCSNHAVHVALPVFTSPLDSETLDAHSLYDVSLIHRKQKDLLTSNYHRRLSYHLICQSPIH